MEELYILGNGFDLYLGLKTKYSDYFKNRKISEEFFEKIKLIFKNSIGSYNYDARGKVYAVFDYDETLLNMQIIQLYKDIEKNLFYLYLIFLKKCDLNWNEVESNILPFIRDTSKIFKLKMETILGNIEKNEMYKYLLIAKVIIKDRKNLNFFDFMMEQLNLFEKDFGNYIGSLELKEKNKNRLINIFRTTCRKKIINFNYSIFLQDLIDRYKDIAFSEIEIARRIKSIESIVNIHGDFKNPIFGIDSHNSEEQFQNFTKTSRILNNDTVGNFELPKPEKLGTINFFGHSLSEADYSYFQSLFDYYDIYSSNIKLNFMYSEYDKNDLTRAKRETHNNVVKLMNNYGEKLENKDKGKNLLHKLLIENRIKLLNIDKRNGIIDNANYSFI
ncbi:AbiH family protein [uncultured Parvimonas sp.]|uniref:AbiH family protein n=1 Tax=uncultured Parvimonas sp. TaxID=747372 RepID=UPI00325F990E